MGGWVGGTVSEGNMKISMHFCPKSESLFGNKTYHIRFLMPKNIIMVTRLINQHFLPIPHTDVSYHKNLPQGIIYSCKYVTASSCTEDLRIII